MKATYVNLVQDGDLWHIESETEYFGSSNSYSGAQTICEQENLTILNVFENATN